MAPTWSRLTATGAMLAGAAIAQSPVDSVYSSAVANLAAVINGTGTNGGIYNGTVSPNYGEYNYCNMPHVRSTEYTIPPLAKNGTAKLMYVEIVHRHHRRTTDNVLPHEDLVVQCTDTRDYLYQQPASGEQMAAIHARTYVPSINPFSRDYLPGSCQSGELTLGGLQDSLQHGKDLWSVYGALLGFLPNTPDDTVWMRTSPSSLTQQVASGVVHGLWPGVTDMEIHTQPSNIDSLVPDYSCSYADNIRAAYQSTTQWYQHLNASLPLRESLDNMLETTNLSAWHTWYDHFFDAFSTRTCSGYPLPCSNTNSSACVSLYQAQEVFRLGDYEYDYIYNTAPNVTTYLGYHYGVFVGELLDHFATATNGSASPVKYRHNIGHDGGMAPLLGILQVPALRWPGLGSELVFELYQTPGQAGGAVWFARVLYGGQPLRTRWAGELDWIELGQLVAHLQAYVPADLYQQCDAGYP